MKTVSAVIALSLLAPSIARAEERDPDTALQLSIVGTLTAVVVAIPAGDLHNSDWKIGLPLLAAIEVLPSAGHIYAGDYVSPGLVGRVAGGGLLVLALADPFHHDGLEIVSDTARTVGLGGLALMVGGTIYDVVSARSAARRYNARKLELAPTAFATANGPVAGVGLGGRF
jgi:hypothetical protein